MLVKSAEYAGKDLTAMARTMSVDGYMYVGSAFGLGPPGAPSSLLVKYEGDGWSREEAVPQGGLFVSKEFVDGMKSPEAGEFRIFFARYGANKWVDVTRMVADAFKSPFEYGTITDHKGAWPCGDPDPNVKKFMVVKFSYGGKIYIKAIQDPDTHLRLLDPTFSVIIPTWNRAKLLPRCVGSVLAQEFDPNMVEVIVVDDGSTDDTPQVMAGMMSDRRVKYARLEHTGCPGLARNHGIELSSGRIIALLDTDDKYKPRHLSVVEERFAKVDCMIARVLYDFVMIKVAEDGSITEHPETDFSKQLWNTWGLYPSCWSFRRELLSGIQKPPFPTRRSGDDTFFWWEAIKFERSRGKPVEHPEEVIEDDTVVYGLISKGNNLSYELMPESQVFRDKPICKTTS